MVRRRPPDTTDCPKWPEAGFSATAQVQADEAGPSVSELAEKTKSLKAAHSIDTTPQRVRHKQSTAEESVTARIRRRTEAVPASAPATQPDAAASGAGATMQPELTPNAASKPQLTYQERIAMERHHHDQGPSLS